MNGVFGVNGVTTQGGDNHLSPRHTALPANYGVSGKVSEFRIFCKSVRISSYYKIKVISRDKKIGGGVFLYSLRTNSIIFRGKIFILCLVFFQ